MGSFEQDEGGGSSAAAPTGISGGMDRSYQVRLKGETDDNELI